MEISNSERFEQYQRIKKKQLTVLIAEDNYDARTAIVKSLEMFFENVYIAKDGAEALEVLKNHRLDLIISDMNMPNVDGVDLVKAIREKCKIFPIIITTAHDEFAEIYKNQPNIITIIKPYSIIEIMDALDKFENKNLLIENSVYEQLNASYDEAKRVIELIKNMRR